MDEITNVCFCKSHRYQHSAGKGCEAGRLSRLLNIDMALSAWLASKYLTAESAMEAVKYSTEENTLNILLRHEYITEAEYKERRDRALEMLYEHDGMPEGEYLRRAYPDPKFTFEELEAANWSPSELGF